MPNQIIDPIEFKGKVTFTGGASGFTRAKMDEDSAQKYSLPWTAWRIYDAIHTNLPTIGAGDDLGLAGNTFGTDFPHLTTQDLKTAGATSERARAQFTLPPEYQAGEACVVRLSAGMVTTVADVSATADVEFHTSDRDGTVSADLCSTSATSINSLTAANYDFTITAASLTAGSECDIRVTLAINDGASGTAVIGRIWAVELLLDIKG